MVKKMNPRPTGEVYEPIPNIRKNSSEASDPLKEDAQSQENSSATLNGNTSTPSPSASNKLKLKKSKSAITKLPLFTKSNYLPLDLSTTLTYTEMASIYLDIQRKKPVQFTTKRALVKAIKILLEIYKEELKAVRANPSIKESTVLELEFFVSAFSISLFKNLIKSTLKHNS